MELQPLWASWLGACGRPEGGAAGGVDPTAGGAVPEDPPAAAAPSGVGHRCRPTGTLRNSKSALLASPCSAPHPTLPKASVEGP